MEKEISRHRGIIFIVFSSFFIFASFILGIILIFFLLTFGDDFKDDKCFAAIDKWYIEKYGNIADVDGKRWQQLLECKRNLSFFPWGKEPKFTK